MNTKKRYTGLVLAIFVLIGSVMFNANRVYGTEAAVRTDGEIVFSAESTEATSTETSSSDTLVAKPKGRFPSTGELVKKSLAISGVTIIILMLIIYILKRKKDSDGKEEGSK